MDRNLLTSSANADEEDYIDMEVTSSSSSAFFCYSKASPPFEFQMSSSISLDKEQPTTSPADELFYKGNLLPLHLPPRLQMVQNLLQHSTTSSFNHKTDYSVSNYTTPFSTSSTSTTTPSESCNISPSESRRVSKELNPDEYFSEFSTELRRFIEEEQETPKKSWSKKLSLIKKSSLGMKLKASKAYFKALFSKSGCSDESCTEAARVETTKDSVSKYKECLNKHVKVAKKTPFGQIRGVRCNEKDKKIEDSHRRSFSGAINRCLATKCSCSSSTSCGSGSSSFSSANSNGFYELHLLKRSSSANSEFESSIQGAIAHCKQSQQVFQSRKNVSEVGVCLFSPCEDQERPGICRGWR